jgi:hypothetical protein
MTNFSNDQLVHDLNITVYSTDILAVIQQFTHSKFQVKFIRLQSNNYRNDKR